MPARATDSTTTRPIKRKNSTAGCGTLFPTRSTTSSSFCMAVLGAAVVPLMMPVPSNRGIRDEQIHAQPLRQKLGHELPLDAVARLVERRGKRPQPALARRDRHDPTA